MASTMGSILDSRSERSRPRRWLSGCASVSRPTTGSVRPPPASGEADARRGQVRLFGASIADARQFSHVPTQPDVNRWALTRALELANKYPVSFSELVEKYCHPTALTDAMRLPGSF